MNEHSSSIKGYIRSGSVRGTVSHMGGVGRGTINIVDIAELVDQDAWVHWKENLSRVNVLMFEPPHWCPCLTLDAGDCAEANLS